MKSSFRRPDKIVEASNTWTKYERIPSSSLPLIVLSFWSVRVQDSFSILLVEPLTSEVDFSLKSCFFFLNAKSYKLFTCRLACFFFVMLVVIILISFLATVCSFPRLFVFEFLISEGWTLKQLFFYSSLKKESLCHETMIEKKIYRRLSSSTCMKVVFLIMAPFKW